MIHYTGMRFNKFHLIIRIPPIMRNSRSYITYIAGLILYGSNGIVAGFSSLSSLELVFLRTLFGAVFLTCIFLLTGHRFSCSAHKKDTLLIALSGTAMAADWLLLFEAYSRIGVSLSIIINYCGPIIVIALSPLFFKERLTVRKICALLFAMFGAVLVSGSAVISGFDIIGLICAILSAFSYSAIIITNKKALHIAGMENATLQLLFTLAAVTVFFLFRQDFMIQFSNSDIIPVLWLGLINTGLASWLYFSSIGSLPAWSVSILGYLEPLSAVFLSAMILKEVMQPLQVVGAVFILGSTLSVLLIPNTVGQKSACKANDCDYAAPR